IQKLGPRGGSPSHTSPTVFSHHIQLNPQLELLSHASREAILNSLAPSTLSAYLTGWNCFKAYHGAYQLPFPTLDVISVCNFITHTHSIRYISPMVDLTLECMFLLAFFSFLRCSEFAPTSSAYNPHHHPSLSDISPHTNDSLIFTLRRSKTDQLGISFPIHIFRLNSYLSPYEPLTKYLSARNISTTSCLFRGYAQNTIEPFLPHRCSVHSSETRTSDQTIQVLGRWSSLAYHAYIRNNLNDLRRAHDNSLAPSKQQLIVLHCTLRQGASIDTPISRLPGSGLMSAVSISEGGNLLSTIAQYEILVCCMYDKDPGSLRERDHCCLLLSVTQTIYSQ
ncbi:hypothetical protein KUCAC02_019401, partial [Chaenocephalus aceratus]